MRISEIKHILNKTTNERMHFELQSESLAGGAYYKVINLSIINKGVKTLRDNNLIEEIDENLSNVYDKYVVENSEQLVPQQDYLAIKKYLDTINSNLPSILNTINLLIDDQDENEINILIPNDVKTFKQLDDVKEKIVNSLKCFKITENDIEIVGFDTGTKWYKIKITNKQQFIINTVLVSIGLALQAAQLFVSLKDKDEIIIQTEVMNHYIKEESGKEGKIKLEEYIENLVQKQVELEIEKYINSLNQKTYTGNTKEELKTMMRKGIMKIAEEDNRGLVFYPSLNPPSFIDDDINNKYIIDYEKLAEIEKKKDKNIEKLPESTDADKEPDMEQ